MSERKRKKEREGHDLVEEEKETGRKQYCSVNEEEKMKDEWKDKKHMKKRSVSERRNEKGEIKEK